MLAIIREIAFVSVQYNFQVRAVHLPGDINKIADGLSRAPTDPGVRIGEIVENDWKKLVIPVEYFNVNDNW